MNVTKINVKELAEGKNTYPTWTTGSVYTLTTRNYNSRYLIVYYTTSQGREIKRIFPKEIALTPQLSYSLGFLKGEGSNALGSSNYRRFTITNSDPVIMKNVLAELQKAELLSISSIRDRAIHLIHHTKLNNEVIEYWSSNLGLPQSKFKCFEDKTKTLLFGVCHVYVSDVLLRRIIDLLHESFFNGKLSKNL